MFSSCFERTKYTCLMCKNHFCKRMWKRWECDGLESRRFGGILPYMLLRENKKIIIILKKPTTRTNCTRFYAVSLGISNHRRQTKFKNRLRLFKANCIWSRLLGLVRTCKTNKLFISQFVFPIVLLPLWSALTAVCNSASLFFAIRLNSVRRLNQLPNLIISVDPNWF